MKYMGSKRRIRMQIAHAIGRVIGAPVIDGRLAIGGSGVSWVEPFTGGANMTEVVVASNRLCCDINPFIMGMFARAITGWEPDDYYTEVEYEQARKDSKSRIDSMDKHRVAEIGFIGVGCSYSGKWFGGYARGASNSGKPRNYTAESKRNLLSQVPNLVGAIFVCADYRDLSVNYGDVVYCDPPYADTTKYTTPFNHDEFWRKCQEWRDNGAIVFVSEYSCPVGWDIVWESHPICSSLTKQTGSKKAVERLFCGTHGK